MEKYLRCSEVYLRGFKQDSHQRALWPLAICPAALCSTVARGFRRLTGLNFSLSPINFPVSARLVFSSPLSHIISPLVHSLPLLQTLTLAKKYAEEREKPFPEINDEILQERNWPKDCYVFEGKEKEPTIIYMPLFNRANCTGLLD